jgi:hypothetical protein
MNNLNYLQRKYKLAERAKKPYNDGGGVVSNDVPGIPEGIDKVFRFMTEEEKCILCGYFMCGMHDYRQNTILMGASAYERMEDYKKEMIAKYSKNED